MFKYNLFILFLGIFVLSLVIVGFSIVGSPIYQQQVRLDEIRLNNFSQIKLEIENYYRKNSSLPANLQTINNQGNLQLNDPKDKTPYHYEILSPISYKLCANFSTDSQIIDNNRIDIYSSQKHKKGYDCIMYILPEYLQRTPTPIYSLPTIFYTPTTFPN